MGVVGHCDVAECQILDRITDHNLSMDVALMNRKTEVAPTFPERSYVKQSVMGVHYSKAYASYEFNCILVLYRQKCYTEL